MDSYIKPIDRNEVDKGTRAEIINFASNNHKTHRIEEKDERERMR